MTKKVLSTIIVALLIVLTFSSCDEPGGNANLVLPIDNEPAYLDPQIISDDGSRMIMLNCMEGLMAYNTDGELVPAAAESFAVSPDGLTYTFSLRKDGFWRVTKTAGEILGENYEETFDTRVTAADFVFAIRRALQPETICPYAGLLMNIKNAEKVNSGLLPSSSLGVSAKDDYTLVFSLEREDCDFLSALASTACLPCNEAYFNATGGRYGLSTAYMIFNGPFLLYNWAEGTAITLRRNDYYRNIGEDDIEKEVLPESVYFSFNSELETRAKKLRDETYHLAHITDEQADELNGSKKVGVDSFASSMLSIVFNCEDELVSNANLRKSIASGLDYSVLDGVGTHAFSILPSGLTLGGEPIAEKAESALIQRDSKKASKLFAAALEELELSKMNLTLLCDEWNETLARTLIQSLQSTFGVVFGIEVEVVDSRTLRERVDAGEFQLALYKLSFPSSIAKSALSVFLPSSGNAFFLKGKKYEELLRNVYTAGGIDSTVSAIAEAEEYIAGKAVIIPLAEIPSYYGVYSDCSDLVFYPGGEVSTFKFARLS